MTNLQPWYDFRAQMIQVLEADLMGGADDVAIDEPPLDRFVLGILHPQTGASMDDLDTEIESAETHGSDGADAVFDPAVALSRMRYPSSMGLTFAIDVGMTLEVEIDVCAARYREDGDEGRSSWIREAVHADTVRLGTAALGVRTITLAEGLDLYTVVRLPVDGIASITVVLMNNQQQPAGQGLRDTRCWFQPSLVVRTGTGRFMPRTQWHAAGVDDQDLDSYRLLYRDVQDLGVGHGCAVTWSERPVVTELRTTFLPWHDVPLAEPAGGSGLELSMGRFSNAGDYEPLRELVTDYRRWIEERTAEVDRLPGDLQEIADRHLTDAIEAADRIARGIQLLESDADAATAFGLMNHAMELQRVRQDARRNIPPRPQLWRPFQMAFILMNLEGLSVPDSPDRELADLLWFPTGGGKTEAYMGLIGYTILLRRLRSLLDGGVSVIMRYTLRLLTVQQFERAAGLICALESLRSEVLPEARPISLGLWVGQGATPNTVKDARTALNTMRSGGRSKVGNPVQLLHCPACGTALGLDDYRILKGPDRMTVRCPASSCEYFGGLPVYLVDEDVYRERPSLVVGTVDKFAMMAWREQVRSLFSRDGKNSHPDLIIQDELHLISGPLGTMVGLYEAAVDAACTGVSRPKVVASTATIRRASDQVRAVFDRESRQFPPPGLDASDSYFSVEAPAGRKGTRRYVGVLAPSTSHTTLMVRCYAALLQAGKDLPGDDTVRDAYWTLVGYFNSLRVLGGAYMQVLDDVPDRLKVLAGRSQTDGRVVDNVGELTSRVDSTEIPEALQALERGVPDPDAQDVVLATNMISVGLDVDRLGLMAVMGQPQTTAEYIQSTSRVGREHPGFVLAIYNASRSRDLSHYENFRSYHRALYRQVEATGATPFAARARDRGLHGVLVSLVRLLVDGLAADERAVQLPRFTDEVERVTAALVQRAHRISPGEVAQVERQLSDLLISWREAAENAPTLKYAGWRDPTGALLQDPAQVMNDEDLAFPVDEPAWPTMTSLRDVDATSGLYLVPPRKENDRGRA